MQSKTDDARDVPINSLREITRTTVVHDGYVMTAEEPKGSVKKWVSTVEP